MFPEPHMELHAQSLEYHQSAAMYGPQRNKWGNYREYQISSVLSGHICSLKSSTKTLADRSYAMLAKNIPINSNKHI